MKKPVIGIVPLVDEKLESLWMLPGYMDGITRAGGVPVMLPLAEDGAGIDRLLELCDGVLLTGGHDVSPEVYGESAVPECGPLCPERDRMEHPLLLGALERNKAVLGICRGLQVLNAVLGGTLYQDLPAYRPSDCERHMQAPYHRAAHPVHLANDAPLAEALGTETIGVNSCHHQGIRDLTPDLAAMAYAPDGLVEAAYMPGKRFVWAVQWHPEFWLEEESSRKIFSAFVAACRE